MHTQRQTHRHTNPKQKNNTVHHALVYSAVEYFSIKYSVMVVFLCPISLAEWFVPKTARKKRNNQHLLSFKSQKEEGGGGGGEGMGVEDRCIK